MSGRAGFAVVRAIFPHSCHYLLALPVATIPGGTYLCEAHTTVTKSLAVPVQVATRTHTSWRCCAHVALATGMGERALFAGIDVGTDSVRAGLFTTTGELLGHGKHPIHRWQPREDFVEQSSDDVWQAVCNSLHCAAASLVASQRGSGSKAAAATTTAPHSAHIQDSDDVGSVLRRVKGLSFDATCSLVVLDAEGLPVSVSQSGTRGGRIACVHD